MGCPTLEALPILLDVPNLSLLGSTVLSTDSRGLSTGQTNQPTILEPVPATQPVGDLPALILVARPPPVSTM
jgi:hypothetical protein